MYVEAQRERERERERDREKKKRKGEREPDRERGEKREAFEQRNRLARGQLLCWLGWGILLYESFERKPG